MRPPSAKGTHPTPEGGHRRLERAARRPLSVLTTTAQGEGALQGAAHDYQIARPFETSFAFSRFESIEAVAPRNVSLLVGGRVQRVARHLSTSSRCSC